MKALRLLIVGVVLAVSSHVWAEDQKQKMVVGIGDIEYKAGGYSQSEAFGDMLVTALVRTRKFKIIERARMDQILQEQGMSTFGISRGGYSGGGLNIRGVDYIITGAITEYGESEERLGLGGFGGVGNFAMSKRIASMAVDIRLLKVEDGEIMLAESVRATREGGASMTTRGFSTGQGTSRGALLGEVMRECANRVSRLVVQNVN